MFRAGLFRWLRTASLLAILPLYLGGLASAEVAVETIYKLPTRGSYPTGRLLKGNDGTLYGTTSAGGVAGLGTLFKYSRDGVFSKILDFSGANGSSPTGFWVIGDDGNYYGTTASGGKNGSGTLFRLTPQGEFTTVAEFPREFETLHGSIVQAVDGSILGTAQGRRGLVWKVSPSGVVTTIAEFTNETGDSPTGGLTPGPGGDFYGTTLHSAKFFKVTAAGQLTALGRLGETEYGSQPAAPLFLGTDGNFYGTSLSGGRESLGTVFRAALDGTITILAEFTGANGASPSAGLISTPLGGSVLRGTTLYGGAAGHGTVFSIDTAAAVPEITVEASFESNSTGSFPVSALAYDATGHLVGTTQYGGENNAGVLFRIGSSLEALFHFGDPEGSELIGLTSGPDGALYGTARSGGSKDQGTFFRISADGEFARLADFGTNDSISNPSAQLVLGETGFYGLTENGGTEGHGVLFEATTAGEIVSLASIPSGWGEYYHQARDLMRAADGSLYINFTSGGGIFTQSSILRYVPGEALTEFFEFSDTESSPSPARLTQGRDGMLYGAARKRYGSTLDHSGLHFFRLGLDGSFTSLANFGSGLPGSLGSPLLLHPDGDFYGTTRSGGKHGFGTVYKGSSPGKLITLASFKEPIGYMAPFFGAAGLVTGPGGAVFGTTPMGGVNELGTIFRMTSAGKLTVIADFSVSSGVSPAGTLVVGPDGNLWGTTRTTIFRIVTNNHPPTATADALELPVYDAKITANDSDPDGDVLTITSVGPAEHGTAQINLDNSITYLPGATFTGTDSFTYEISDGLNGTATATVVVTKPADLKRASAGTYSGFLSLDGTPLGTLSVKANGKGSVTATISFGRQKTTFKALLDEEGNVQIAIPARKRFPELAVNLQVDPATNSVAGVVTIEGQELVVELSRAFPAFSKNAPTPHVGRYSVLLRLPSEAVGLPDVRQGTAYATAKVTPTGLITFVGKLTDGTPFSAASQLSRHGQFPFYAAPYAKQTGFVAGLAALSDEPISDFSGGVTWQRMGQSASSDPFSSLTTLQLLGARYSSPASMQAVFPFVGGHEAALKFLDSPLSKRIYISPKNQMSVRDPGEDETQMKLKTATGLFSGTFLAPGEKKKSSFGGVVYQKGSQPRGEGFYRQGTTSNGVLLDP